VLLRILLSDKSGTSDLISQFYDTCFGKPWGGVYVVVFTQPCAMATYQFGIFCLSRSAPNLSGSLISTLAYDLSIIYQIPPIKITACLMYFLLFPAPPDVTIQYK